MAIQCRVTLRLSLIEREEVENEETTKKLLTYVASYKCRSGCNARGAKGVGHRRWAGSTGNGRSPTINGRRQPSCGGTSRISREPYDWFCEGCAL